MGPRTHGQGRVETRCAVRREKPIRPQRDGARTIGPGFDHVQRRQALGMTGNVGEPGVDDQTRAVLHQAVADETEA